MHIVSDRKLFSFLRVVAWAWLIPWAVVVGFLLVACLAGLLDEPAYVYTWSRILTFAAGVLLAGSPGWGGIIAFPVPPLSNTGRSCSGAQFQRLTQAGIRRPDFLFWLPGLAAGSRH